MYKNNNIMFKFNNEEHDIILEIMKEIGTIHPSYALKYLLKKYKEEKEQNESGK